MRSTPKRPASHLNLQQALARFEQGFVQNVLQLAQGDRQAAAQLLEIPPETVTQKLRTVNDRNHSFFLESPRGDHVR